MPCLNNRGRTFPFELLVAVILNFHANAFGFQHAEETGDIQYGCTKRRCDLQ